MDTVSARFAKVKACINAAAHSAGRKPDDITLVAVSKYVTPERMQEAYDAGVRHFGENRAQELRDKVDSLPADCHWHFIGGLQVNKVKYLVGRAELIHSVDSMAQVTEIERRAASAGLCAELLIQVNIAGEAGKGGITPGELDRFADALMAHGHVRLEGLMMIPPKEADAERNRPYYSGMNELFHRLHTRLSGEERAPLGYLSMGMSGDYEMAIEEGANIVRIGSALFGPRQGR